MTLGASLGARGEETLSLDDGVVIQLSGDSQRGQICIRKVIMAGLVFGGDSLRLAQRCREASQQENLDRSGTRNRFMIYNAVG